MTTRIRLITPHITPRPQKLEWLADLAGLGIELSAVNLETGPTSIESEYDAALAAPYVVGRAVEARKDGIDAVVIDCMGDPGLHPAREAVTIPVIGPGETALHVAAMLGQRTGFITVLERIRPLIRARAAIYGIVSLATIRAIDVPVLDLDRDPDALIAALAEQSLAAIVEEQADVIVLGCTGYSDAARKLAAALAAQGHAVPVVDPLRLSVLTALTLVHSGLSQSKLAYPPLAAKEVHGYTLPEFGRDESQRN